MPPYSERSVLPSESSNSSVSIESDAAQLTVDTTSGSLSAATTPSPTDLEIFVDVNAEVPELQEETFETEISNANYYPTPGDSMPFDHALPDFLRQLTNERNLANVFSLRLRVISRYVSLQRMSLYTINLRELNLEGSILSSLRDIGCNLKFLQILKVGSCQLDSLDGTFGLTSLRKLYAQKNLISDVTPCSNLPYIQHIDLSFNRIRNIAYAGFLTVCRKLKSIVFTGNPAAKLSDYRFQVRRILPQIESLDNITFCSEETVDTITLNNEYLFKKDYSLEASEDGHYDIYNNSFEGDNTDSIPNESKTFEKIIKTNDYAIIVEDNSETQEMLKRDNTYLRARDSQLLSLRKEKDEDIQIQSACLSRGKNIDFEETDKISDYCCSFNANQIQEEVDNLSLPPLCVKDNEQRKLISSEKETYFLKGIDEIDLKETKSKIDIKYETSTSFSCSADDKMSYTFNLEDRQMGVRPRVLSKCDRLFTAGNTQLLLNSHNDSFEDYVDPQKKRSVTASSEQMLNEYKNSSETMAKCLKFKSLTTGPPMCGNLAVALRNRKKYQQEQEDI